ncbi:MAG TPA: hypothetical protein VM580_18545, partial [Labilithrix sp.]|nr:hypothetical protein [Labilithrix sp.]
MSEGVGPNTADSSGNANDGTISGAAWTTGCSGTGLSFDGVDDFVDLGFGVGANLNAATAISLSAWIRFGVTDAWKHVVTIVDYATDSMTLFVDGVAQTPISGAVTFQESSYLRSVPTQTDRIGSSPANVGTFDATIQLHAVSMAGRGRSRRRLTRDRGTREAARARSRRRKAGLVPGARRSGVRPRVRGSSRRR